MSKSDLDNCKSAQPYSASLRLELPQDESDSKISDLESLEYLHSDAQRTLDAVIETNNGYATKALGLIRVNGLVLTILVALANQSLVGISFLNWFIGVGVISFFISIILSVNAYFGHDIRMGIGENEVRETLQKELDKTQYLTWILYQGYSNWLTIAQVKIDKRATYLEWATISFTVGVIAVMGGIFIQL